MFPKWIHEEEKRSEWEKMCTAGQVFGWKECGCVAYHTILFHYLLKWFVCIQTFRIKNAQSTAEQSKTVQRFYSWLFSDALIRMKKREKNHFFFKNHALNEHILIWAE